MDVFEEKRILFLREITIFLFYFFYKFKCFNEIIIKLFLSVYLNNFRCFKPESFILHYTFGICLLFIRII